MANAIVPWPGPVPEPGPSNVMIVGCSPTKGVFLKLRTPSFTPRDGLVARVLGPGLAARAVFDSAIQAKRMGIKRKTCDTGEYLTDPLTQALIIDLR